MKALKQHSLLVASVFTLASSNVMALDADSVTASQSPLVAEFVKLNVSANGQLTPEEASKDKLFTQNHFTKADTDKNGVLDENEYVTYKSAEQQKVVSRVVDDSVITAQAKAELLAEKDLKSLQISVETHKGHVILSGFVDNQITKKKAEQIVGNINGVKSVKNSLVIKG